MKRLNSKDLRTTRLAKRDVYIILKEWNCSNNDRKRRHYHMHHRLASKIRFKEFQEIHKKNGILGGVFGL